MPGTPTYRIFPLGDSAITLDFGNQIDEEINRKVLALFHLLIKEPLPGTIDVVPAYSSIAIYYDVYQLRKKADDRRTVFEWMKEQLEKKLRQDPIAEVEDPSRVITIPVCYAKEFAPDIDRLAKAKQLSVEEVIQIHTSRTYRVYMLGFLPGFSYMAEVDTRIEMPRREESRQSVEAGSVGIAGKQTGIYPLVSPGGWQIIGRTPVRMFDANKEEPIYLKAGDRVQFISISKNEFENY